MTRTRELRCFLSELSDRSKARFSPDRGRESDYVEGDYGPDDSLFDGRGEYAAVLSITLLALLWLPVVRGTDITALPEWAG